MAGLEARVARGGVLVALQREVVGRAAADREGGRVEHLHLALLQHRAGGDDELSCLVALPEDAGDLLRREHHALLRKAQIAARRTHDPPDEEIEEDEEQDLEEEQDLLDGGRGERHVSARSNTISVEPSVIVSPLSS